MSLKGFHDRLLELTRIKRPPEDPNAIRYGEMLDRSMAAGIDLLILYTIFHNVFEWFSATLYSRADQTLLAEASDAKNLAQMLDLLKQSGILYLWLINTGLQVIILGMFIVGMQILWQATPGKIILGLKIVRRGTLVPVERWRYVLRYFGYIIIGSALASAVLVASTNLIAGLGLLGVIMLTNFNKERRCWHDRIAGTVVINMRPTGWYWNKIKQGFRWLRQKISPPANDNKPQE